MASKSGGRQTGKSSGSNPGGDYTAPGTTECRSMQMAEAQNKALKSAQDSSRHVEAKGGGGSGKKASY